MTVDYKIIGERIKITRLKKKITQAQLSEALDISIVYLSKIERGATKINIKRLLEICQVLEMSPGEVLLGTVEGNKNYLDKELSEIYVKCNGRQKKLIYEIAKLIKTVNV